MDVPRARVCLTFDFDAISPWLVISPGGKVPPGLASRGEYGARVGASRILELLEHYRIRSTWFIPGHTIDTFPSRCREVVDAGHEVAHHGYCHESPSRLSEEAERQVLEMGIACIERLSGRRPIGYRAPSGDSSPNTMGLLSQFGFRYDSSLSATDFSPYWARAGDTADVRSGYHFGRETDVVEIPVAWHLEDFSYYEYTPGFGVGHRSPSHVLRCWQSEFDYMYEEVPAGVFTLVLHPQSVGRGSRLVALEQFIQHVRSLGDCEFRTMAEVNDEFRVVSKTKGGGVRS